jgi:hypothetical protein
MRSRNVNRALLLGGLVLALAAGACGKKAPLRLTDERTAEHAPDVRGRVRLNRVTLDFRVPQHRFFPEREEPWVLARILRQSAPSGEVVEAGAILQANGFAFGAPLTWTDQVQPAKTAYIYRVEFRDAIRRRRAVSEPLKVGWERLPNAPSNLSAAGRLRAIVLTWTAPSGAEPGLGYRVYRREPAQEQYELLSAAVVTETSFVDSRVEPGRRYCYEVRAALSAGALEVEGSAGPEECAGAAADELPPPAPPAGAP